MYKISCAISTSNFSAGVNRDESELVMVVVICATVLLIVASAAVSIILFIRYVALKLFPIPVQSCFASQVYVIILVIYLPTCSPVYLFTYGLTH